MSYYDPWLTKWKRSKSHAMGAGVAKIKPLYLFQLQYRTPKTVCCEAPNALWHLLSKYYYGANSFLHHCSFTMEHLGSLHESKPCAFCDKHKYGNRELLKPSTAQAFVQTISHVSLSSLDPCVFLFPYSSPHSYKETCWITALDHTCVPHTAWEKG